MGEKGPPSDSQHCSRLKSITRQAEQPGSSGLFFWGVFFGDICCLSKSLIIEDTPFATDPSQKGAHRGDTFVIKVRKSLKIIEKVKKREAAKQNGWQCLLLVRKGGHLTLHRQQISL